MAAPQIVVCGGGVIGSSVAYFLATKHHVKPIVVEATGPACSASGKAGGFLALDWCDSSPVGTLARRSFALHAQLATELGSDTGYRSVKTHSISVKQGKAGSKPAVGDASKRLPALPSWVARDNIAQASVIGSEADTAQVNPELFTKALLRRVEESGGSVQIAAVTGVVTQGGRVTAVKVYPRPGGEVYICGVSEDNVPVPATAADVHPRPAAIAQLQGVAASVSQELGSAELLKQQACYLPCSEDGLPVIGRLQNLENAYVATAHSCWGILNAPATGEALAELIMQGAATSSSLSAFDPCRPGIQAKARRR